VDRLQLDLQPQEATTVNVSMDPCYKKDLQSCNIKQRLVVTYLDNPQKDGIDLIADIQFPNLEFETHTVDFGSALTDTTRRQTVMVTNTSKAVVQYCWTFVKQDFTELNATGTSARASLQDSHSQKSNAWCAS
jgi:hydrocephalus-inducing protein